MKTPPTEEQRFAAATKLASSEYTGAVFCDGGPPSQSMVSDDGDCDYHASVAEFLAACAEADEPVPEYVWACRAHTPSSNVGWIIESALEDHHEDAGSVITKEHVEKLKAFMREWWAASGVVSYRPDYTRAVVLDVKK